MYNLTDSMGYAGHWRKSTIYLHIYNIHVCMYVYIFMGFPGGVSGKEPTCQCRRCKNHGFDPWIRKIPWRRAWQPTLVFLPGEPRGQRSLVGSSPWGHKELDMIEGTLHACMLTETFKTTLVQNVGCFLKIARLTLRLV